MASEQSQLELVRQLLRDARGHEPPESGVHAIGVLAFHRVDQLACGGHPCLRAVADLCRGSVNGDVPHVRQRQVVSGQNERSGHGSSLDPRRSEDTLEHARLVYPGYGDSRCRRVGQHTLRHEPDQLATEHLDAAPDGFLPDSLHDFMERGRAPDRERSCSPGRDRRARARARSPARRASRRRTPGSRRRSPCHTDVVGAEIEVVRDERRSRSHENRADSRIDSRRAGIHTKLVRLQAPLELAEPPERKNAGRLPRPTEP